MSHCLNVICNECGVVYCIRCNRVEKDANPANLKDVILITPLSNTKCNHCKKEKLFIY